MDNMQPLPDQPIDQPLALLRFYADAGVDCALLETPRNRLQEARAFLENPHPPAQASSKVPAKGQSAAPSPEPPRLEPKIAAAIAEAEQLAASAQSLDALQTALVAYAGCPLSHTAKNLIFGCGPELSSLMIIGEAPGADEDRLGEPFSGSSGILLDHMLKAIGLNRNGVRIGMSIFWRPPGNRAPTEPEKAMCKPFLRRHIALANPDILLLLGTLPAQILLGETQNLLKLRGHWFDYALPTRTIPTLVSLPPANLLRQPTQKAHAWRDLKSLKEALNNLPAHS